MSSQERIEQLEKFVAGWSDYLKTSQLRLGQVMGFRKLLDPQRDKEAINVLDKQIVQESNAANEYKKALTFMESILGRARAGEDV